MKYIDADKLRAEVSAYREKCENSYQPGEDNNYPFGKVTACEYILEIIDSLKQEQPDKETILRICKLHKAWSIIAPWENVEDFIIANWNSENIV